MDLKQLPEIQTVLAVGLFSLICYLSVVNKVDPKDVVVAFMMVMGYFFARKNGGKA